MKTVLLFAIVGVWAFMAGCQGGARSAAQSPSKSDGPEGDWSGTLSIPGGQLRLVFHVTRRGGALKTTLDSPDQGAFGIACDKTEFKDGKLTIELTAVHGTFEGTLDRSKNEIAGTWTQGAPLALTLKRGAATVAVRRPQEPKPPFPYEARDVTYENSRDKITLAGTLTLPKGAGPFPAALLITGSGPQNRDEELMGHKPFLVLADYLTRRGVAVLRVDDRGVGASTGSTARATTQDFAQDVKAGVAYLRTVKVIDPKKIGLIGHSEGGLIAPMVAAEDPGIAFIVLMAGTGVTGEQVLYKQAELINRASGVGEEGVTRNRKVQEMMFAAVREEKDEAAAEKRIVQKLNEMVAELPEAERNGPQASPAALQAQAKAVLSPWFRFFLIYDPATTLKSVKCPVLAIDGEKDLQVGPAQNLPAIKSALEAGGNKDVQTVELPGLNHLFQTCKSGTPAEYGQIEETMSPIALKTMGDWIAARMLKR